MTVILLVAPVTVVICDRLRIAAKPYLIAEVLASNIGGAATLIGDPPNIIIGSRASLTFNDFLVNKWRAGALFGLTPDEAFFVKCDRETNPASGIDAGEVVCQIGVAPVKPAEFVVFRLSQFSGGTSLVAE